MHAFHAPERKGIARFAQPLHALAEGIEQRQIKIRLQNAQRHARKAGARADVHDFFAAKIGKAEQCGGIQQMQLGDGVRLRDAREVHDGVFREHERGKMRKRFRFFCVEPELAQTIFEKLLHLFAPKQVADLGEQLFLGRGLGRSGRRFFLLLFRQLMGFVERLDHAEDGKRDDDEVENDGNEVSVIDRNGGGDFRALRIQDGFPEPMR